jgi:transcriptional regulator with XRE-family HTH domain
MRTPKKQKPSEVINKVALIFRDRRKKMKLSQEELGAKCDLHRTYIGAVERAERNICIVNLQAIATALKLRISII